MLLQNRKSAVTRRALLLAVGSTRFAQIDYADRSVAAGRSARFYGPLRRFPVWGGALDKVGRDCYHKSRKSVATSG